MPTATNNRDCKGNHFRDITQMITQEIHLPRYRWHVSCYFAVDAYYIDDIARRLAAIGCHGSFMERAIQNMASRRLDRGLTYSNSQTGESVLVVSLSSNASQAFNSIAHELHHLVSHISQARGVPDGSEEQAYIMGDLAQEIHPTIEPLICQHCREKLAQ